MMKEAEDIILKKKYFELTPSELELLSEYAKTEEDFEEMKWFLKESQAVVIEDKIEASTDLKKNVFAHLHQDAGQKRIWLNGLSLFLFPKEKKFYQLPALQIAAVAVFVFGLTFMIPDTLNEENLALKEEDSTIIETPQKDGIKEDLSSTLSDDDEEDFDKIETRNLNLVDEVLSENEDFFNEPVDDLDNSGGTSNGLGISGILLDQAPPGSIEFDDNEIGDEIVAFSSETISSEDSLIIIVIEESKLEGYKNKDKSNELKKEKGNRNDKNLNEEVSLADSELLPSEEEESGEEKTFTTSMAGGAYEENYSSDSDISTENSAPKVALHIEETKELKSLFYTIK